MTLLIILFFGSLCLKTNAQSWKVNPVADVTKEAALVKAADIDGDGDLDVVASFPEDTLSWFENQGNGSFARRSKISNAGFIEYFELADLDNDGDIDIASSRLNGMWFENLGGGTFAIADTLANLTQVSAGIEVADLNQDGRLDILTIGSDEVGLYWYENLGSGQFAPEQAINIPSTGSLTGDLPDPTAISAADLDGDGDIDVLAASSGGALVSDELVWYENTGFGTFGPKQVITDT
ncbi:MAG: FG-GAP repeat domain-containing protein, partial [Bacteroidota bacterium]